MSHQQPVPAPDGISQVLAEQSKWNKFTPIIEDLYLRENLPDHVVGYIMRTLYNFSRRCVYSPPGASIYPCPSIL